MTRQHIQKTAVVGDDPLKISDDARVYVYEAGGILLASIYDQRTGGGLKPNPFDVTTGVVSFYADPGRYDIVVVDQTDLTEYRYNNFLVIDEDVVEGPVGALMFATVSDMVSGSAINRDDISDWSQFVGQKVKTVYNNTTSKAGGAEYIIKTAAQAAADGDVVDGTGSPNYIGGNHYVGGGAAYVAVLVVVNGEVDVTTFGAVDDWTASGGVVTDSSDAIEAAINFGLDIFFPDNRDSSHWYYISRAMPTLGRWQSMRGTGYTQIKCNTSSSDYTAFTIRADSVFEGFYVEGTSTENGTGLAISAGNLSTDFASTCTIRNCWFRILKVGLNFDNAFTVDVYSTQFRQCATGTRMSPTITDLPDEQYLAAINYYTCRWNGNTVNDVYIEVSGNSRCRGINFHGCTFDPMGAGATESVKMIKAALVCFDGCYLEADTSATVKQIDAVNSVFIALKNCVMTGTGGINLVSSQIEIDNVWSFSPVSPANSEDPIIADSNSVVSIKQSTLRSDAHNFLNAARVTLIDATIRISGTVQYIEFNQYRNGTPSHDEGTFTPEYIPGTGSFTSITYDTNNTKGYYIKDGNKVYVSGVIRTTSLDPTGASGDVLIDLNIPYVSAAQAYRSVINVGEVGASGAFASNYPSSASVVANSANAKLFYRSAVGGADLPLNVTDLDTTAAPRNYLHFTGTIILDAP